MAEVGAAASARPLPGEPAGGPGYFAGRSFTIMARELPQFGTGSVYGSSAVG